jgi:aryl sulfotransferase
VVSDPPTRSDAVRRRGAMPMSTGLPSQSRVYLNHHLDSTRWSVYEPRADDIVVSTSIKSGTTWMQAIVRELIVEEMREHGHVGGRDAPLPDSRSSCWPDARFGGPVEALGSRLAAQRHRRFLKTHLPLDGLTYRASVKYVVVARDPRDVFMSLWNHYSHFTPESLRVLHRDLPHGIAPCPPCPDDVHAFWASWIGRGWFAWEEEGFPFWGNMHHSATWWGYRHLPNIELFHYADLLAAPHREIARLAAYLGIEHSTQSLDHVVAATTLTAMRERHAGVRLWPPLAGEERTFFHAGVNGRWRDVLTEDELSAYERVKRRVLPADCAAWLETGAA